MKGQALTQLFITELAEMYDSENQIIEFLPHLIELASYQDLKEALTNHLNETKNQVKRLKKVFSLLDLEILGKNCIAMKSLLQAAEERTKKISKSFTLDAAIISATQKVEHYEMASYGTLRSFANHLGYDKEIIKLLQETLDEEGSADKKLTKIADGTFFSSGVNKEAVSEEAASQPQKRR
ncbi:ferritin-like domain-containing protein [Parachlamydia sp. AcF125]|uniref:YciE/YciF ferroxidase family protein n=1 Tax=Parachlamydia sp. AcF125 TaxID=2795736 RepID=UPI001BC9B920|nr:ferritin-like domain-containing protein [Parachlamydia sp. AcF125]MBS4167518.1 Protein YciF [Parachlamydia sp. AcF125]